MNLAGRLEVEFMEKVAFNWTLKNGETDSQGEEATAFKAKAGRMWKVTNWTCL